MKYIAHHSIRLLSLLCLAAAPVFAAEPPAALTPTEISLLKSQLAAITNQAAEPVATTAPDAEFTAVWPDMPTLKDAEFNGLPLEEVARSVRNSATNAFDIILPTDRNDLPNVTLQLRNVGPAQIFTAMNLQFEMDAQKWRWVPFLNGGRPTVALKSLSQKPIPAVESKLRTTIFYCGDLLLTSGAETRRKEMDDIAKSLAEMLSVARAQTSDQSPHPRISVDGRVEVLVVTATDDEIEVIKDFLTALKLRVHNETIRANAAIKNGSPSPGNPIATDAQPGILKPGKP